MFTEVFLNYNCMSLPHFRTVMSEIINKELGKVCQLHFTYKLLKTIFKILIQY